MAIGADGTVDISPRARLFITEAKIIEALYIGVKKLLDAEAQQPKPASRECRSVSVRA